MQTPVRFLFLIIPTALVAFLSIERYGARRSGYSGKDADAGLVKRPPLQPVLYPPDSWCYFLQHLPTQAGPILDFKGNRVEDQEKHVAILTYDVGNADLQQCADALIRLRSEYLFGQKKYDQIGFHFNSGDFYPFSAYLHGIRPVLRGNSVHLLQTTAPTPVISHRALRQYLDIVYAYANTVSLCRELKSASRLKTGTVIIFPGHPGHCCLVMDEAIGDPRDTVYKLVEGYMPAQSIYVLANPFEPKWSPWYHLGKGEIQTASYSFESYYLKKFE
jgi:hypothetical protein